MIIYYMCRVLYFDFRVVCAHAYVAFGGSDGKRNSRILSGWRWNWECFWWCACVWVPSGMRVRCREGFEGRSTFSKFFPRRKPTGRAALYDRSYFHATSYHLFTYSINLLPLSSHPGGELDTPAMPPSQLISPHPLLFHFVSHLCVFEQKSSWEKIEELELQPLLLVTVDTLRYVFFIMRSEEGVWLCMNFVNFHWICIVSCIYS